MASMINNTVFVATLICCVSCYTLSMDGVTDPNIAESAPDCCSQSIPGHPKIFPHESNCSFFYVCQYGEAVLKSCPPNLHFNPHSYVCDYPKRAGCEKGGLEEIREKTFDQNVAIDCPEENPGHPVLRPHPGDCESFYICDGGKAYPRSCQKGLHFNAKLQVCDFPTNAQCETGITDSPRVKVVNENGCPEEDTETPVLLPHPSECEKFYICDGGKAIPKSCQPGLHFNPKVHVCDYPENAQCDTKVTKSPRNKIINENGCPAENSKTPVLLPHPTECEKFYICDSGIAIPKTCQSGLHFNPRFQSCDYPENVRCDTSYTKSPRNKIINENGCPVENSRIPVLLPHPIDCGKFYICDSGNAIPKSCQPGLHFNPKVQSCDFPENAQCERIVTKSPRENIVNENGCPVKNSGVPVFLPHPTDCGKFFICDGGIAHEKNCPLGLHFNPKLKACDYPKNTQCNAEQSVHLHLKGFPSLFCPSIDGKVPIFFRHSTNCSIYFMCSHGNAYEFECPARLHFNLRKKKCDYEINSKCQPALEKEGS